MAKSEGRTEKPTHRRRRKARSEGRIVRSAEVPVALSLLVALIWSRSLVGASIHQMLEGMRTLIGASGAGASGTVVRGAALDMLTGSVVPLLGLALAVGLTGAIVQSGLTLAPALLGPKFNRISPKQGLQRLKPTAMVWEGTRSVAKLGLLALVAYAPVKGILDDRSGARGLAAWLSVLGDAARVIVVRVVVIALAIAAADYVMNRLKHVRSLRMTKQEVKEEHKQSEGDPMVRAHRRRRALEISRNRMITDVSDADVVITNPTHYAVALRYTPGEPAPRVVAKGMDTFALKIRKIAYRHGVLVRSDPPLARVLYRRCRVGSYVPSSLYEAVAAVLAAAYRRRKAGVL